MSPQPVLEFESVSKRFCKDLKRSLKYGVFDLFGELFLRDAPADTLRREEFWALRDVSFSVVSGETLGVIGHNGAGKSTLLKLINGLIKPSSGTITTRGRVGALIELGTGFNPVLTGRENVFVNAAVLGIPHREVRQRFDEIVEFAELGEFIDAPVRTYSSGMKVRLGFAVASTLRPSLLLIDEILAVGDAMFREKSYARMLDYKRRGGTLLFVSHNSNSIEVVSDRVLYLDHGQVVTIGEPSAVIHQYQQKARKAAEAMRHEVPADDEEMSIETVEITDMAGKPVESLEFEQPFKVRLRYTAHQEVQDPKFWISFSKGLEGSPPPFSTMSMLHTGEKLGALRGPGRVECVVQAPRLTPGDYALTVGVSKGYTVMLGKKHYVQAARLGSFEVTPPSYLELHPTALATNIFRSAPVALEHSWSWDPSSAPESLDQDGEGDPVEHPNQGA